MILEIVSMKARVNATMSSLSVNKDIGFWFMEYVEKDRLIKFFKSFIK